MSELRRRSDSADDSTPSADAGRSGAHAGPDAGAGRAAPRYGQPRGNDRPAAPRGSEQVREDDSSGRDRTESGSDRTAPAAAEEVVSPEERARRIKYNVPDDPAKRALTPEQQAAIARLTGTQPGGPAERYGRRNADPPRAARAAPPAERVRPQAAPESASVRERPVANRPAAEHPVAERPVANGPAERPVANRPGTDRTAANHPGTDQPGTERSENRGPADARPGRDTHEAPVDSGDLQATIADLRKQLADSKSEVQAEKAHSADLETRLAAEQVRSADLETRNAGLETEVADLKTRVAERDGKLAEQATDIGSLKETAGKHEAAIGELLGRVARMESAGTDGPARAVEQRESPQPDPPGARLDHPEQAVEELPDQGRADAPAVDEQGWAARADGAKARRAGPSNEAIGFWVSTATTVFSGVSDLLPPTDAALGIAGGLLGVGAAGIAWVRRRSKEKNAD